jgi:3'-5' exoribonuclease
MTKLPKIAQIEASSAGWGFFLCARKDVRTGRSGEYLTLVLQDVSGEIRAKVFQDVNALKEEFSAGEFVKVQGRGNSFNQQVELVLEKVRRVMPERDAVDGFREDECIPCAPRPPAEMWQELLTRIEHVSEPSLRRLLGAIVEGNREKLISWPAALTVHHAYRSGLLEHILKIVEISIFLSNAYLARTDLVIAGAILHDIGKLYELTYDTAAGYSVEGNLLGHIAIGFGVLRDAVRDDPGFPPDLALELEHLILSHHGSKENGSPVEPMTVEAFVLAMADDLDAKVHQVRRHVAEDDSEGPFTSYHKRLGRVLFKPSQS